MPRHHHHVYVVELDDRVWNEPRFRKANPDHRLGMPFVYVGMTGLDPMPYRGACEMEVELAIALREAGYGVWQG